MQGRRQSTAAALRSQGLDGLLAFKQETMYYLTGYDSFGFSLFQCLVVDADGNTKLLTRLPDLRQPNTRPTSTTSASGMKLKAQIPVRRCATCWWRWASRVSVSASNTPPTD